MNEEVINNPDKMNELIELQGKVQEQIDQVDVGLDSKLELAMDALRTQTVPHQSKIFQEEKKKSSSL